MNIYELDNTTVVSEKYILILIFYTSYKHQPLDTTELNKLPSSAPLAT